MRFLVDNALSPLVAQLLRAARHDVVHLRDRRLQDASDVDVMALAAAEQRVLVSADTDFGTLLALSGDRAPSVVILRRSSRRPEAQAALLLANLARLHSHLDRGAVAILEQKRIRVRTLPIERTGRRA